MNLYYKEILVGKIEDLVDYGHIQLGTIVSNDEFYKYREDIESNNEKVSICVDSQMYEIEEDGADKIRNNFKNKHISMNTWMSVEFYGNNETDIIALIKNDGFYNVACGSLFQKNFHEIEEFINRL